MDGKLSLLHGEKPAMDDFDDHLSTIFPEVRLKTFLEMRGADAGPQDSLCALSAFWVGLLYDETALDGAWELVKHWNATDAEHPATDGGRPVLLERRSVARLADPAAREPLEAGEVARVGPQQRRGRRGGLRRVEAIVRDRDGEVVVLELPIP